MCTICTVLLLFLTNISKRKQVPIVSKYACDLLISFTNRNCCYANKRGKILHCRSEGKPEDLKATAVNYLLNGSSPVTLTYYQGWQNGTTCSNFSVVVQLILAYIGLRQQPENLLACPNSAALLTNQSTLP